MGRRDFFEEKKLNKIVLVFIITLLISIVAFVIVFSIYNEKLKYEASKDWLELGKANDIVSNDELKQIEETSFSEDKSVSEQSSKKESKSSKENKTSNENKALNKVEVSSVVENKTNTVNNVNSNSLENSVDENTVQNQEELKADLSFIAPVSGEISKDFALDTLIYSNTLEEWTTHSGIDIKAEKTTIVVASERGVVESIKNDPRYGLTITIVHDNNFKTIYSNLLTTEFVKEGEIVEKGQTIATIGESASFEIADESHLHFEMYKDGILVNPTIYLEDR